MTNTNFTSILLSYTSRVKVAALNALALALLLVKAAPADLSSGQRKKLDTLVKAGTAVEDAQAERDDGGGASLQPLRAALASAFGAVDITLEGISQLPASVSDKAERALVLRATLLPDGRVFTKMTAVQTCMYARRVLARIDQKKLAPEMKDLLGPEYLKAMQSATDNLGEALGLGESDHAIPSATAIADAMTQYTTALCGYTRALSADVDENDQASCDRFMSAVAPIDEFRSGHTVDTTSAASPSETPTTPAAPVVNGTTTS